ncbi:hypothetical protein LZ683_08885 [Comamonas testosteroni]|uniref:hypothetical protein n=1 Tax=Comamonas testosteroni TaxID=285 RepID=UPI0023AAA210|nr:hypothetical protein [Comamonas testosteroni]WEE79456.1 hypothetical protein LZ683_08885 [Comamonas testosteroni]
MTVIIARSDMQELFEAEGFGPDAMGAEFVGELGRVDDGIRFIADECLKLASVSLHQAMPQPERPYYRQRQRW